MYPLHSCLVRWFTKVPSSFKARNCLSLLLILPDLRGSLVCGERLCGPQCSSDDWSGAAGPERLAVGQGWSHQTENKQILLQCILRHEYNGLYWRVTIMVTSFQLLQFPNIQTRLQMSLFYCIFFFLLSLHLIYCDMWAVIHVIIITVTDVTCHT